MTNDIANNNNSNNNRTGSEIAVIGMSGRFPGAPDIDTFWENLKNATESLTFFTDDSPHPPNFVKTRGGLLADKDAFDAVFFNYTPIEAEVMDPQTRIFHECTWRALENAGYNPHAYDGLIGLFAGSNNHFEWQALTVVTGKAKQIGGLAAAHLNDKDYLCSRISHKLNLTGPVVAVQTACSTSLTAIHLACQSLLNGECDMALAGGSSVTSRENNGYLYQEGLILSPDGHCRAFDAKAKGTANGEGAAAVVLKLLEDAENDGDFIHAIIKGSAINNDGFDKSGYTAPSPKGQSDVISVAQQMAEVASESITYIETHGTGTPLGDPIEIEALKRAFNTDKKHFCAIGAVKTNVGHLGAAAGVTGFIKTVLALKHKMIPATLHFERPNPNIDLENSPFYVNTQLKKWERSSSDIPLRAGVSSFGIGGTNAHVILEEAPVLDTRTHSSSRDYQLVTLSAQSTTALDRIITDLAEFVKTNGDIDMADLAYTLKTGRGDFRFRRSLVFATNDRDDLIRGLEKIKTSQPLGAVPKNETKKIVFMFSGLGSQYVNMGRELYLREPRFREAADRCFNVLSSLMDVDIKAILYPGIDSGGTTGSIEQVEQQMTRPEISQPVIFLLEYALAQLLMGWGIEPDAMIGYSFGEYVAACIAGVFSPEDALRLVVTRGKMVQQMPEGVMLSVPLTRNELLPLLKSHNDLSGNLSGNLSLSIDNGTSCIVSGSPEVIGVFETEMKAQRLMCMRLQTDRAVHSHMMVSIRDAFAAKVGEVTLSEPQIPYISNVTGTWCAMEDVSDPAYWGRHLCETVRFAEGIEELVKDPQALFIEMGPGRDLSSMILRYLDKEAGQQVLNLVRPSSKDISDLYYLLDRIGRLWVYGKTIDWTGFYEGETRYRLPLPTYPFDKQRFFTVGDPFAIAAGISGSGELNESSLDPADWYYLPSWRRSILPVKNNMQNKQTGKQDQRWLIFSDGLGVATSLMAKLEQEGIDIQTSVRSVTVGNGFVVTGSGDYVIDPSDADDYKLLFSSLNEIGFMPDRVVHCWGVTGEGDFDSFIEGKGYMEMGFYSILYLVQAIGGQGHKGMMEIHVVTDGMQEVSNEGNHCPEKSIILGLLKTIPQEHPGIRCKSIDITYPLGQRPINKSFAELFQKRPPGGPPEASELTNLYNEITTQTPDAVIALRGDHRWVESYEPLHLEDVNESDAGQLPLKKGGTYLITGGLGKIGRYLARFLAETYSARLVLTTRSTLPLRSSEKRDAVAQLETMGGEVLVCNADAGDREQMERVIHETAERFGSIDGVIHAAGITGGRTYSTVRDLNRSLCEEQFRAKVQGLMILDDLFKEQALDFCWVISSISAVLGGLRFGAYASANSFMDAYTVMRNRIHPGRWLSVAWDGMDYDGTVSGFRRTLAAAASGTMDRVAVSTGGNLQDRIDRWVKLERLQEEEREKTTSEPITSLKPRPHLLNDYAAPRTETEKTIAAIWERMFGIADIGVQDDFFELGGDSLKAITVIARIHQALDVEVPLTEFFKRLTIAGLAEYIGQAEHTRYSDIPVAPPKKYYALSSAQKRFYVLQEMDKESIGYNETQTKRLTGDLDRERFEESFRKLMDRHESLRTSIRVVDDEPVQEIHPLEAIDFSIQYFDSVDDNDIQTIIRGFIRPFDLGRAPFFRVALIKQAEDRHIAVIDKHHIITDGVSTELFVKEFSTFYRGEELEPLRIQYKDYAEWRNSDGQQQVLKKQETYWLERFSSEVPVLELPYDFPRPVVQSFEGSNIVFRLDRQRSTGLKTLTLQEDATLFMVLTAIYYILLSKLSGSEDIVIGTPVAGRNHADLQKIMGIFVNTLALRHQPEGKKTFREFLQEIKRDTLTAFENQDYPFEDLVEAASANVNRDMSRNPLFDAVFVLQNTGLEKGDVPNTGKCATAPVKDLRAGAYEYDRGTSKFDLKLEAMEEGDHMLLAMEYCSKLFKRETVERFIAYFKRIISVVLETPDTRLMDIQPMDDNELDQVLHTFNETETDYPSDRSIHELLSAHAARTPDTDAVTGPSCFARNETVSYTYGQLDEFSTHAALRLREKGLVPGAPCAVMTDRFAETPIVLAAILKAGGAYLPIDPGYPADRIRYILEDSCADTLITTRRIHEDTGVDGTSVNIIYIDEELFQKTESENIPGTGSPDSVAYIIYTSGSTGRPKGVMVEHRNVVRLVKNTNYITFNEGDRLLQTGALEFDASTFEIWGALLNGMTLFMVPKDDIIDGLRLKEVIQRNKIDMLWLTSALFNQVSQEPGVFAGVRDLLVGGDVLSPTHINRVRREYPGLNIINGYGPTENTTFSTTLAIDREYTDNIPIGRPISNSTAYIVDQYQRPVPIGITGELIVGGDGVARGYLNQPELTAERFSQSHPSHLSHRSHLSHLSHLSYKTGDLARWLPDGTIQFLGRKDFQVKIRGFRIELGEIEAQLAAHPDVNQVVVIARQHQHNHQQIVAYVVGNNTASLSSRLRSALSETLPHYMIPTYFIQLEYMPLTANGKIDLRALPEPGTDATDTNTNTYTAPTDRVEQTLAAIWSEILDIPRESIGIDDNFFQRGGHSLKATVMVTKIHKRLEVRLPLAEIFKRPTIRESAQFIRIAAEDAYTAIQPVEDKDYYPLTSAQKRLFIIQQMDKTSIAYNLPRVVKLPEHPDADRLRATCQKLIERHESLRTSFTVVNEEPVQRVHKRVDFDISYWQEGDDTPVSGRLRRDPNSPRTTRQIIKKFVAPFQLDRAPLLRVGTIEMTDGSGLLLLDMHHIISDGVSDGILVEDFMKLYNGEELTPLTLRYRDYAEWEHKLKDSTDQKAVIKKQEQYWLEQFKGPLPVLNLPTDFKRPPVKHLEGSNVFFQLTPGDTAALKAMALEEEVTLYMMVLALLYVLFYKLSGQEDIVIGSPVAGRKHADLQQIIGMFVGTLALRNYPNAGKTFKEFLAEIKQRTLEAFENQDYPFEELQEKVNAPKDPSRNPVFDVLYQFSSFGRESGAQTKTETTTETTRETTEKQNKNNYQYENQTAKFDLYIFGDVRKGCLFLSLEYAASLFKKETVEMFTDHFKEIVSQVIADGNTRLGDITISFDIYDQEIAVPEDTDFVF